MKEVLLFLTLFFLSAELFCAPISFSDYKNSSIIIGKWFSKATSHYDFVSATPIATRRAGKKFMIAAEPATQYASDYGLSYSKIKRDQSLTDAYETIGADTSKMPETMDLMRLHVGFGFTDVHDLSLSYMTTQDTTLSGYGVSYKRTLINFNPFYFSWRVQYSTSKKDNFFTHDSVANDFSVSAYLRLIDFYAGVRHTAGRIQFNSSIPELTLPEVEYISGVRELEYFYGIVLSTTTNSRLTVQANKIGEEFSLSAKFSLRFDSLLPLSDGKGLFRDPRYIKQ